MTQQEIKDDIVLRVNYALDTYVLEKEEERIGESIYAILKQTEGQKNLEAVEIISGYILKTKDVKIIDLLQEIQRKILNNIKIN